MIPSYLELITAFKTSLATKRDEISAAKKRYEVGLEKLAFATESVNAMQVRDIAQQNFTARFETTAETRYQRWNSSATELRWIEKCFVCVRL